MGKPKVVLIAAPPLGSEVLFWLLRQPCEVVWMTSENRAPDWGRIPDYDVGLNFLGTHKVPAGQLTPPKTWLNFHPAPLPEYRGRNLCYHAIMEGATEFGASAHFMDAEYDTGDLIEVCRFPIVESSTAGDLLNLSRTTLVSMFQRWVPVLLAGGQLPRVPQPKHATRYHPKTPIDEAIPLPPRGDRLTRALTCAPNHYAYVEVGGRRYKLIPEDAKA